MKLKRSVEKIMEELAGAVPKDGTLVCIYADREGNIRKAIGGRKDHILAMANIALMEAFGRKEE